MTRFYPGSDITLQAFVRDENGDLTAADTVEFFWRMRHWREWRTDETGTVSNPSTGVYESTFTPEESGNLYYRWEITDPDIVSEGALSIKDTQFPRQV